MIPQNDQQPQSGGVPDLFGEALLGSAALDRLTHGAHYAEITGASLRAEHTKRQTVTRRSRGRQLTTGTNPNNTKEEPGHRTAPALNG